MSNPWGKFGTGGCGDVANSDGLEAQSAVIQMSDLGWLEIISFEDGVHYEAVVNSLDLGKK